MRRLPFLLGVCLGPWACKQSPSAPRVAPSEPLPTLALPRDGGELEDLSARPYEIWGEVAPESALALRVSSAGVQIGTTTHALDGEGVQALKRQLAATEAVLIEPVDEVFLAEVMGLLALLEEVGVRVWMRGADSAAFPIGLCDEQAFQGWLDTPAVGKVRIIQRADGFELVTGIGKLPGPDPNGPSIPVRGGRPDVATLREGLLRVKERFGSEQLRLVPSFGTPLRGIALALTANYAKPSHPTFEEVVLVFPRRRGP